MAKEMTKIQFMYKGRMRTVHSYLPVEEFKRIVNEKKLTKEDIEVLAKDIKLWARENRDSVGYDMSLLYNGKHDYIDYQVYKEGEQYKCKHVRKVKEGQDPHKWCEWFPEDFILGMTVDGQMYEMLNYGHAAVAEAKLRQLLKAYGLYLECADYCYWYVVPYNDMEVEYTHWEKEKIRWLYGPNRADDGKEVDVLLNYVMEKWYDWAKETGDIGCCTIGEYMEFKYEGIKYRMSSQSPYQGDYSWSAHVDKVKEMLRNLGATHIYMNYGRMD